MSKLKQKSVSVCFALLLVMSATSTGFLFGRTAKLQQQISEDRVEQIGERVVTAGTFVQKSFAIVKRVLLK